MRLARHGITAGEDRRPPEAACASQFVLLAFETDSSHAGRRLRTPVRTFDTLDAAQAGAEELGTAPLPLAWVEKSQGSWRTLDARGLGFVIYRVEGPAEPADSHT